MLNHNPIKLPNFNGLWDRGDELSCPPDHFTDAQNLQFFTGGFRSRDGVLPYQDAETALANAIRMFNYKTQTSEGLLVLVEGGDIYHLVGPSTIYGPILSIPEMTDFNYTQYAGRAYITPFATFVDDLGVNYQKGLENEFLYVYLGDGTPARKAGGAAPTGGPFLATLGGAGFTDPGLHIFAVVYETDTGYLTAPGPAVFAFVDTSPGTNAIDFTGIPVSPDSFVTKRHIIATKIIPTGSYNGDQAGFQFFFLRTIENNIDTTLSNVSFYDIELLEDASYLLYVLAEIPAGVAITTYHSRLVLAATFDDISLVMVSVEGEPENISELSGYMIFPLDSRPVTNAQEFRDVLYVFKQTKTGSFIDNGSEPSSWPFAYVDQGVGTSVHGISKVLDSEGINVNYLIIADYSGVLLFGGAYERPELSYKISNRWLAIERNNMHFLQFANDSVSQFLYIVMPDGSMFFADYSDGGISPKSIKWCPWIMDGIIATLALIETNKLVIGFRAVTP